MKLGKQSKVECRSILEQLLSVAKSYSLGYKMEPIILSPANGGYEKILASV